MALLLDPERHSVESLSALVEEFVRDLTELRETLDGSPHRVVDPASLVTAHELLDATLAILRAPGSGARAEFAAKANLGYATLVAVIDLYKSHTDAPRTPRRSTPADAGTGTDRSV